MHNENNTIILSKTVYIENGILLRKVENIDDAKTIIKIIEDKNLFNKSVVNTKIYSEQDKLLEHEILPYIIHSGEYTESMAMDVTKTAMEMSLDLYKCGIFSWDLMPHNYTYLNGEWILYDFGSFALKPDNVKTQIRSLFKISFSSFELTKRIKRKYLKHYYLNRIKAYDLFKMIPLKNWLFLFFKQKYCLSLFYLGLYEKVYSSLNDLFNFYYKPSEKHTYPLEINESQRKMFDDINRVMTENSITSVFCAGNESAKFAASFVNQEQNSCNKVKKFVYIDDYDTCDDYYNLIREKSLKTISTAVLYPYVCDDEIPSGYKYRALYDDFAKERFISDAALLLNYTETFSDNLEEYLINASDFTKKMLILSLNQSDVNLERINDILKQIYLNINILKNNDNIVIIAKDKIIQNNSEKQKKEYMNNNRGPESDLHTEQILKLLKSNLKTAEKRTETQI